MIEKFSDAYIEFLEKNKLLPLKDAAKMLNMHPATLRSFAKSKSVKHVRIGKKYYFNLEDIRTECSVDKKDLPHGMVVSNGYIKVNVGTEFPAADANGYVPLHRIILEAYHLKRIDDKINFLDNNTFNIKVMNLEINTLKDVSYA